MPCGIRIKVEKRHLVEGEQNDPNMCAIALALKEQFGDDTEIGVDVTGIEVGNMGFKVSQKIKKFIRQFDNAGDTEYDNKGEEHILPMPRPFSFYLSGKSAK